MLISANFDRTNISNFHTNNFLSYQYFYGWKVKYFGIKKLGLQNWGIRQAWYVTKKVITKMSKYFFSSNNPGLLRPLIFNFKKRSDELHKKVLTPQGLGSLIDCLDNKTDRSLKLLFRLSRGNIMTFPELCSEIF